MGKFSKSGLPNKKKAVIVTILAITLTVIGAASYYLLNNKNLSSENASAGRVKTLELNGLTLKLEQSNLVFARTTKEIGWKYTLTGKANSCYGNIQVSTNTKDAATNSQALIATFKGKKCNDNQRGLIDVNKAGSFTAPAGTTLNFVIDYTDEDIELEPRVAKNIDTLEGFKLVMSDTRKTKIVSKVPYTSWSYTITGSTNACYSPSSSYQPIDSKSSVAGYNYLRLTKYSDPTVECAKRIIPVKQTGVISGAKTKIPNANLIVRYFASTILETENKKATVIQSNGLTLKLTYAQNSTWNYEISGNLPSACHTILVDRIGSTRSLPETVTIPAKVVASNGRPSDKVCAQVLTNATVKGTLTASQDASFKFNVTK